MAKQKTKLAVHDKRTIVTPERKEQLAKQGWQRGKSGNPAGRPATPKEVKMALASRSMRAVEVMEDLMENCENAATRQRAAAYFIDPFVARAAPEQKVNVDVHHHVADLLAQVNAVNGVIIEATEVKAIDHDDDDDDAN